MATYEGTITIIGKKNFTDYEKKMFQMLNKGPLFYVDFLHVEEEYNGYFKMSELERMIFKQLVECTDEYKESEQLIKDLEKCGLKDYVDCFVEEEELEVEFNKNKIELHFYGGVKNDSESEINIIEEFLKAIIKLGKIMKFRVDGRINGNHDHMGNVDHALIVNNNKMKRKEHYSIDEDW